MSTGLEDQQGDNDRTRSCNDCGNGPPRSVGDLRRLRRSASADAAGVLLGARMPVILTNRAESVCIANHVVASLYAYADGVAAAGIDKVGG